MGLKISANTFAEKRYLEVSSKGVAFCETAFLGGARRFSFHEIECVLMSEKGVLSFQVGQEVFSIPTRRNKDKHRRVIGALLQEVKRATAPPGQGPV